MAEGKKKLKEEKKKLVKAKAKKTVKKELAKNGMAKGSYSANMALAGSKYLRTILDPVNNPGIKIPDEITVPSYTLQVLTKFLVTAVAGTGGNTAQVACGFSRTLGCTSTNTHAVLSPNSTNNSYTQLAQTAGWQTTLAGQMASYRLVSAKATMSPLSSLTNTQGRMLLCFIAPNQGVVTQSASTWFQTTAGTFTAAINENVVLNIPLLADIPGTKLYAEARYLPSDDISRSYEGSTSVAVGTLRGPLASALPTYGGFVGIWDGAVAGSSLEVNIWENYECIPVSSLIGLTQPTASLSDPIEMAVASNAISSEPNIAVAQSLPDSLAGTAQVAKSDGNMATSVSPVKMVKDDSPGLMDKLLSGAGAAVDFGKKVAPIATSLMALL